MKRLLFLLFCLAPGAWAAEQPVTRLGAEFWFSPRHGDAIAARADLGEAVRRLMTEPEAYLVLHHPETESGELWGRELQAWLVSLGVVSDRIELQADPERVEAVEVVLVDPTVETPAPEALQIDAAPPQQAQEEPGAVSAEDRTDAAVGEETAAETAEQAVEVQVETEKE